MYKVPYGYNRLTDREICKRFRTLTEAEQFCSDWLKDTKQVLTIEKIES